MTEVWLLIALIVVVVVGVAGVILAISRSMPDDDELPERWRKENERDRGKQ
jgi:hypothetical protein